MIQLSSWQMLPVGWPHRQFHFDGQDFPTQLSVAQVGLSSGIVFANEFTGNQAAFMTGIEFTAAFAGLRQDSFTTGIEFGAEFIVSVGFQTGIEFDNAFTVVAVKALEEAIEFTSSFTAKSGNLMGGRLRERFDVIGE